MTCPSVPSTPTTSTSLLLEYNEVTHDWPRIQMNNTVGVDSSGQTSPNTTLLSAIQYDYRRRAQQNGTITTSGSGRNKQGFVLPTYYSLDVTKLGLLDILDEALAIMESTEQYLFENETRVPER
jgi:hypothetical protein